jgi:hypothetical protein
MRRRSLVGPLLLIGIGALFLARNVMPELPLLDYLAQYWPLLLVLWGTLRLVEITIWSVRGQALPLYGVSGGEWLLVVFLCMFGLSLHTVRGFTSWFPRSGIEWGGLEVFGESYDYPVATELAAGSATPRITVEGIRGKVRISGTDSTAVKVSGRQTIRAVDQDTAERSLPESKIVAVNEGGTIVIRPASVPPQPFSTSRDPDTKGRRLINRSRRVTSDIDIAAPKGAVLVVRGQDTDVDVSGMLGSADIAGDNTSVRLENIAGEVRVDVSGSSMIRAVDLKSGFELKGRGNDIDLEKIAGPVTVSGSWSGLVQMRELAKPVRWNGLQTTMTFQGLPGDLRMTIGDISGTRIEGPLRIESSNKDIDLVDTAGPTNINLQRGDIRISAGLAVVPEITVRAQSGSIEVTLPEKAKFNLNAATDSGDVSNEYGGELREQDSGRRGHSLVSSLGGASVDLHLNRGDITVRSGSVTRTPTQLPVLKDAPKGAPPAPVAQ